jgi:cholesterol transport system auxiliary component
MTFRFSKSPASGVPHRREFLIGAAALALSGCAALNRPELPQLYVLKPDLAPAMGAPVRWRLAIAAPDAVASLDTPRIALSRSATTMDYFANAAWPDRVTLLLQRMLVQAFDMSGRIVSVDKDTTGIESDYVLQTDIRNFEARYASESGPPQIVIGIQAKLVRMPERDIVGGVYANEQAAAASNTLDGVVAAFNQASGAAISRIVDWTLSQPAPAATPQATPSAP